MKGRLEREQHSSAFERTPETSETTTINGGSRFPRFQKNRFQMRSNSCNDLWFSLRVNFEELLYARQCFVFVARLS